MIKSLFYLFMIIILLLDFFNNVENFVPNQTQFGVCNDPQGKGETYYQSFKNNIGKPLDGFFSWIVRATNEKNLSHFFKPPKCYGSNDKNNNYFNDNKIIDISNNTWKPLSDPFYKYQSHKDNYAVMFDDSMTEDFLKQKNNNIKNDHRLSSM